MTHRKQIIFCIYLRRKCMKNFLALGHSGSVIESNIIQKELLNYISFLSLYVRDNKVFFLLKNKLHAICSYTYMIYCSLLS